MTDYKIDELAHKANVSPRTIRYYVQRGLLPAPEFRGKDTAYGHAHLLRLRAIKRLQQSHLPLDEIQARIASASERDLERIASGDAEDARRSPSPAPPAPPKAPVSGSPYRFPGYQDPLPGPATPLASETWERVRIAPGLELHLRGDAGPEARRVAREILSQYGQGFYLEDDRTVAR